MTGRQRLKAVLDGQITDKVPHMVMVFQLEEEALGLTWPTRMEMDQATASGRERCLERFEKKER